jgi:glycolate oxidase FAD binding subunit
VIDHRPGDLICTVSADVSLADLNAELATAGQMLALDPPGAERLTIGEVFDGALSGPRSHRYGEPRDLIVGIQVELADGTVSRAGGRVVKNVAGYDLGKLFTGAEGRLGRIREVTVRLHPLPTQTCSLRCAPCDPRIFEPFAPACVELNDPPAELLVRFESPVAGALARRALVLCVGELVEDDDELWAEQREAAASLHGRWVLPAEVPDEIERLRAAGATRIVGRAARGRLYSDVVAEPSPAPTALEQRVIEAYAG